MKNKNARKLKHISKSKYKAALIHPRWRCWLMCVHIYCLLVLSVAVHKRQIEPGPRTHFLAVNRTRILFFFQSVKC